MHLSDYDQDTINKRREWLARYTMLPMLELPLKQAGSVGNSLIIRAPKQLHRAILDAHLQRFGFANAGEAAATKANEELLIRIANVRGTSKKPVDDPLFWIVGIRGAFWPAPYTRSTVESLEFMLAGGTVPTGFAKNSTSYKVVASWACRCLPYERRVYEICGEIRHKVRKPGRSKAYYFPEPTTQAWLAWARTTLNEDFEIPERKMGTGAFHRDRWQKMGFGPKHAERLQTYIEAIIAERRRGLSGTDA